ncbi:alanine racemase [Streptomyces sp. ISL-11]|uniref:alanine racemase n=1 Tax=Streptomyces sp. ISL-11 TaxID=2819174 RepID=UPI001BE9B07F|nr:alanine racemase [Streptomyces sp. ISL-11]MBT2383359.1 alanine racemase [Streptomyces sp. ISL-11]
MADPTAAERALRTTETPAYVYDLAELRANRQRLRAALPGATTLYYSLKANPHPAVLAELRRGGLLPEVCSPGELAAALDAGWPPDTLLYTGPGKRDTDLALALDHGVRHFSVDSAHALDQLDAAAGARAARVRCLLRVNDSRPVPGQGLAMTGVTSQFGVDTDDVLAAPKDFAGREYAQVVGLHLYMGTNMSAVDELLGQFAHALATAGRLRRALGEHGVSLDVLDLGGGFGAPFAKDGTALDLGGLRAGLEELLDREVPGWRDGGPEIVFESGRYLAGTAGTLVTTVLDVKTSHGRPVAVTDAGIHHLGGMSGLRRLPLLNPRLLTGDDAAGRGEERPTVVAGPLCTPLDTWSKNAPLPPLRPGDRLRVPNTGAYGLYASLVAFLGHPPPLEVVVDGDLPGPEPLHVSRLELRRTTATEPERC